MLQGNEITTPCFSPVGYLGLSVSYDLRFPELYRKLTLGGAQILMIPSSFKTKSGGAHFETLIRSRAIENQCYVVTANQGGTSHEGVVNFGHSMVVDPWGDVIAQSSEKSSYFLCELDLEYLDTTRSKMNCLSQIRFDSML